ncbi:MAG: glucosamine-6-phosphate deaminase [Candidatus Sericytochromatia bacterium]|nr:glucosamine-6-phosphate deaminase [Candidatus Sericytochromatia bacterium]
MPISFHVLPDEDAVSEALARHLADFLRLRPRAVLALPSGNTPIKTYAHLARAPECLAEATVFALDEYVGIPAADPRSFAHFFATHLFGPCRLPSARAHVLNGCAPDLGSEAVAYEAAIAAAGGLDMTVLGLGANGHIAFNEPAQALSARTHVADLAPPASDVAPQGITMGVATLLSAPRIVLIATGAHKQEAVARMAGGSVDPACPASLLQVHPDVNVFLDTAAAAQITGI